MTKYRSQTNIHDQDIFHEKLKMQILCKTFNSLISIEKVIVLNTFWHCKPFC